MARRASQRPDPEPPSPIYIPPPKAVASRRCPSCGSRLPANAAQCQVCGATLTWLQRLPRGTREVVAVLGAVVVVFAILNFIGRETGSLQSSAQQAMSRVVSQVPTGLPTFTAAPPSTPTLPQPSPYPPTATPMPKVISYTVKSGDTLYGIAESFGVPAERIENANQLNNPESLSIGDVLAIPAAPSAEAQLVEQPAPAGAGSVGVAASASPLSATGPSSSTLVAIGGSPLAGQGDGLAGVALSDEGSTVAFDAPIPLGPADGAAVADDQAQLSWSSVGILPADTYYVVAIRDADAPEGEANLEWVYSNATSLRLPRRLRPALGATRVLEWSVSARLQARTLFGPDKGIPVSGASPWRRVTWKPAGGTEIP